MQSIKIIKHLGVKKYNEFGEVFLAVDSRTGNKCVLKRIIKNNKNQVAQQRLRDESTFSFDAKGLPKIISFEENETEIFLVRNYVEGIELDKFFETVTPKKRPEYIIRFLKVIEPIFATLNNSNVVHCDIKPSNIIIDVKKDEWKIELIDFGLALNKNLEIQKRKVLFPLGYASPELILNHLEVVDHKSDLFALGIVIHKLLTGKLPLSHSNPLIYTNLQITHPIIHHQSIPKSWRVILDKMCYKYQFRISPNLLDSKEIRDSLLKANATRYQNLRDVIEDLEHVKTKKRFSFFS